MLIVFELISILILIYFSVLYDSISATASLNTSVFHLLIYNMAHAALHEPHVALREHCPWNNQKAHATLNYCHISFEPVHATVPD